MMMMRMRMMMSNHNPRVMMGMRMIVKVKDLTGILPVSHPPLMFV